MTVDTQVADRLGKRALPAIVLLVVLSFASMGGLLIQIAWRQDQHAADQARAFARAGLERRNEVIAKDVKDYAAWGEAYQHLHVSTDVEWAYAQQNLGRTLYADLGYDDVIVVGPRDEITYAVVAGDLVTVDKTVLDGRALDKMVRAARRAAPGESKPVTGYVMSDEGPFLVGATAITTGGDPTISLRPGLPSVLVLADAMTPARLSEIGEAAFVHGLRADIAPHDRAAPDQYLVEDAGGQTEIAFRWTPETPGRSLLVLVLPWLAVAGTGFSVLVFFVLHRAFLTAKIIENNAKALAEANRHAEHLAMHDAVTGLANRIKLNAFLEGALQGLEPPDLIAVLYIDLDRFKMVNDGLGHRAGDLVLVETAARMSLVVSERDLVSRVGGDEFVVVLARLETASEAEHVSCNLLRTVQAPIAVEGQVTQVGLSIGIAVASTGGVTADEILRTADVAMYEAKMAGGSAYRFFSPKVQGAAA